MTNATCPAAYAESLFSLKGKPAVVRGASQGIARAGADVMADFSVREEATALVADLAGPNVDILINNGRTIRRTPAADHCDEDCDEDCDDVGDINLRSTFILSREVGRTMMERGQTSIVNTASLLSVQCGVNVPGYTSPASAVAGLTRPSPTSGPPRASTSTPGYVATANTHDLCQDAERSHTILERIPVGCWAEASDIGGAVLFPCSHSADYVHGSILPVDSGWLAR